MHDNIAHQIVELLHGLPVHRDDKVTPGFQILDSGWSGPSYKTRFCSRSTGGDVGDISAGGAFQTQRIDNCQIKAAG